MPHKPIAIKLIKPELVTTQDTIRRFHPARRSAASKLDHPNIVTIRRSRRKRRRHEALHGHASWSRVRVSRSFVKAEGALRPERAVRIAAAIGSALAPRVTEITSSTAISNLSTS